MAYTCDDVVDVLSPGHTLVTVLLTFRRRYSLQVINL